MKRDFVSQTFLITLFITVSTLLSIAAPSSDRKDVLLLSYIDALQKDPASAEQAAIALGKMGVDATPVVSDLIEAFRYDEEKVAQAASDALLQIGPAGAVRPLQRYLNDANYFVRRRAASTLGRFGPEARRTVPDLIEMLHDPQLDVRTAAEGALINIGDSAIQALSDALRNTDERGRKSLIETLGRFGPPAVPVLMAELKKEESSFLRLLTIDVLSRSDAISPDVLQTLSASLRDLDEGVRVGAADALGRLGNRAVPAYGDLIVVSVTDHDALVRQKATNAVAALGPANNLAMPSLTQAFQNPSEEVRRQCIDALAHAQMILQDASPLLLSATRDPDAGVRLKALQAGASLSKGSAAMLPLLRNAMGDGSPEVRSEAIVALGRFTEAQQEAAAEITRALSDPNPAIRQKAIQALGQLGTAGLTGLVQALGDSYTVLGDEAGKAIVKIGQPAVPSLQALQSGPDPAMKKRATSLLRRIQQQPTKKKRS